MSGCTKGGPGEYSSLSDSKAYKPADLKLPVRHDNADSIANKSDNLKIQARRSVAKAKEAVSDAFKEVKEKADKHT